MTTKTDVLLQHEIADVSYDNTNIVFVYLCVFCNEQFYCDDLFIKHLSNKHFVEIELNHAEEYSETAFERNGLDKLSDKNSCYSLKLRSAKPQFSKHVEPSTDTTTVGFNAKVLYLDSSGESEKTDENKQSKNHTHNLKKHSFSKTKNRAKAKPIYNCTHCQKQYQSKSSLENHRKVHENIDKIKCRYLQCSKTFTSNSGYFHHMRTHTQANPFQCQFCGKIFYQKCNLQVHIRRCHTLDKPYKCQYCEKAFASSTDRQIHQRLHTGEKPFFCDICGKEFITSSKMTYHRKLHFEVKKYCCKKCNEKYSTRSLLYKHSLDHVKDETFDCEVCGKRCRSRKTLSMHKKLHGEE